MSLEDTSVTTLAPPPAVTTEDPPHPNGSPVVESRREADLVAVEVSDESDEIGSVSGDRATDPGDQSDDEAFGLTRGDRRLLLVAAVVCLVALTVQWVRVSGWGARPVEVVRQQPLFAKYRLDVNSATWVEWMQIESIGEVLARRIVEDRDTHGPFESVDDLERVSGIGPKTLEKLRPYVEVRDTPMVTPPVQ